MQYSYYTVDVFTRHLFGGAQIAVFPEAAGLDDAQLAAIARELNLSETVFIFPPLDPEHQCRLRVYTPAGEAGFGSHTTIAAAHVLAATQSSLELAPDDETSLQFELGEQILDVRVAQRDNRPVQSLFATRVSPLVDYFVPPGPELAQMLGLEERQILSKPYQPLLVGCEKSYLIVPLNSYEAVRSAVFDAKQWSQSTAPATMAQEILLFSKQTEQAECDFHLRLLGPALGRQEDPPVGAAIPAFAGYLCAQSHVARGTHAYVVERGTSATRQSILSVEMDKRDAAELTIRVGGSAVLVCEGRINLAA